MKHAYLIIAHNQFELLKKLILSLDHKDNDIYLHIDKKATDFERSTFDGLLSHSKLIILENRLDVKWGDYSQIECELQLIKRAVLGEYDYYHLMSGVDMPLKSQDEIHEFFNQNNGTLFVHFDSEKVSETELKKVKKYHFIISKNKNIIKKLLSKILMAVQFFIDRTKKRDFTFQKGANWFSITNDFACYLLEQEEFIKKTFKHTLCCDEFFLQTVLYNSPFKDKIVKDNFCNNYQNILYCIDWERGSPYVYTMDDLDMLLSSNMFFARKFDYEKHGDIVDALFEKINKGE